MYFLLASFVKLHSQLCKGSLGDPIINITFGSGSNPGPALNTTTNLQYVGYDCPNDGSYTVRSNTSSCFANTWYNIASDHTGDANGYFMLINASLQKSEFYIDTVKGLCPNTTYEYAAWLMNVIVPSACEGNSLNPNLTFNIEKTDGTILQTFITGEMYPAQAAIWKQYGFFFKTPSDASDVVVRIFNNSMGGCGNDLAIDDITFRACGAQLSPFIVGIAGDKKELCVGDNTNVTLSCKLSEGMNNPAYQWQESTNNGNSFTDIPNANTASYVKSISPNTPSGRYMYRLSVAEKSNISLPLCRVASSTLTINLNDKPAVKVFSNSPVCEGAPIILSATGGSEYVWSGVNAFSATGASATKNRAKNSDSGKYYVNITSTGGCKTIDSTIVSITAAPKASTTFNNKTICEGESVFLSSSGGSKYLWSPSAGLSSAVINNPVAKPAVTTIYSVFVQNESSCKDSATVTINVITTPTADAGPDRNILEGQSIQLAAVSAGNNTRYSWLPNDFISNRDSLLPIVNPTNDITYFLTVTSDNGCGIAKDSVKIHVFKKVIIPNAFSPNRDGINDTWNIKALNTYADYEVSVFNRYGQTVFNTKNYSNPWNGYYDGHPLPFGTYYYVVDLKQGLPKLKGYVIILQ